jgi:hypothetical protein
VIRGRRRRGDKGVGSGDAVKWEGVGGAGNWEGDDRPGNWEGKHGTPGSSEQK